MRLIQDAIRDLRAHPVRSALAALSLFVAVLSLVGVATIGTLVREIFVAQDEQLNGRLWTMTGRLDYGTLTPERLDEVVGELDRIITNSGGAYILEAEVGAVAQPLDPGGPTNTTPGPAIEVVNVLVAGDLERVRRLPVIQGTWIETDQVYPGDVVLNQAASLRLGGVGTPLLLSQSQNLPPIERHVSGVVSDGRESPRIYQSLISTVHNQPSAASGGWQLNLFVHYSGATQSVTQDQIRQVAVVLESPPEQTHISLSNDLATFLTNLRQMQTGFLAVSIVTLLVAIIGLLNIGLATLRERIRELCLRRALGATRRRIFALVLASTLLLCSIVAAVTVVVAYLGVQWWLPGQLDTSSALEPPGFPWPAALLGVGAALAAGVLGGLLPAAAAARVDVAQVLRE